MKQGHLMPLHDHPKMTVFFKVMRGRILLSQYQVINQETKKYKKISRILEGPSEMIVLEEGSWTMHKFLILSEEAVVLDIIGPPYDDYERKCSYFQDQSEIPGNETVTIPERAIKVSSDQNVFSKDNSTKDPASRSQSTLVLGDHQSNSDLNPIVSNQLHSLNSHHNSVSKTIDVLSETKQVAESKFDLGFETFQLPNGVVIPLDICELVQLKVVDIEYHSDTSVFDVFASD